MTDATTILDRLAPAIAQQLAILATIPAEIEEMGDYNPDHAVPAATLDGLARSFTRECAAYVTGSAQRLAEARGLEMEEMLYEPMDALLAAGYEGGTRGWLTPAQAAQRLAYLAWLISGDEGDRARAELIGADLSSEDAHHLSTVRAADPQYVVRDWIDRTAEALALYAAPQA